MMCVANTRHCDEILYFTGLSIVAFIHEAIEEPVRIQALEDIE
jgi:hypothetical protein